VEDRISGLQDKVDIKEKNKTTQLLRQNSKVAKGICKNSATPSKDQTCESGTSKKEKRWKPKEYTIYSTK
jgi:hypothetical protein